VLIESDGAARASYLQLPLIAQQSLQWPKGRDPFLNVPSAHHQEIEQLIRSLAAANLLTKGRHEIALPPRYLNEIVERDLAAGQLRNRCEPELLQCEWSESAIEIGEDEGADILAARAECASSH
jgi:hypothetical protein